MGDADPILTQHNARSGPGASCWLCWLCWRGVHGAAGCCCCRCRVRRRHVVTLVLGCVLLYGLYVLAQIRLVEQFVFLGNNGDLSYHVSAGGPRPGVGPGRRPLPECARPPPVAPWLLDTAGCRIPAHAAFSDEVKHMIQDFPAVVCADPPPLVVSNDTHIMVEASVLAAYNVTSGTCCYTAMWRFEGPDWQANPGPKGPLYDGIQHGNDIRYANACLPFEAPVVVPHEFVRVTCTSAAKRQVYKDFHAFVPIKQPRGQPADGGVTARASVADDSLNVLVVGIDSVSRLNFIRKMPRTRAFVEDRLGARGMLGYNKVEDNTFPNLVPLLSGMTVPELREACWKEDSTHFDACPWVWKRFNREGYVNMFAEDTAWMGLFHYLKRGFANQPTDYDPRPLLYLGEHQLGRGGGFNAKYCIGQRHQIEVLFDYGRKFVRTMALQRRKFFGILWGTSLSHDMLNQPDEADAMYESFLTDLEATGLLNNTALVFMSDHGLRFGSILDTYQGYLENMLPFMYVVLPEWVRRRYPLAAGHLECNRHSLVTLFDLHQTFYNFMDLRTLEDDRVAADSDRVRAAYNSTGSPPRGISLFTAIPGARTCDAAGIPHNYCSCQLLQETDTNSTAVVAAVQFLVKEVNMLLAAHGQCSHLEADKVLSARCGQPLPTNAPKKAVDERECQTTARTRPGGAVLSATVRQNVKTGGMKLAGSVGRLNSYGNTSWCVDAAALKPLCYCRDPAPAPSSSTHRRPRV